LVAATPSVGMTTMLQQTTMLQPSPMTAGTPIILAPPRTQTPQLPAVATANVTSLPSQTAVLAAAVGSHTPANAATVPTSGLVYSYDTAAYLQRMLEYSAGVEASAIGQCSPVLVDWFKGCSQHMN